MVFYRGGPWPTSLEPLRQAGVAIGLALSSRELAALRDVGDCSDVFVSVHCRTRSILAKAFADLEANGRLADDTPVQYQPQVMAV